MSVEQLGKYTLLKKIAVGGMAEIHLAEQSGPGGFRKQLVIKRILPHLIGDEKFLQMFQDEARVAAMMNHPHIVQIFELGEDEGLFYIAMEYVPGFNLRTVIQVSNDNGMWLLPEYIAKLGSQICEGLEYAHNFCDPMGNHLGLIHRDVSPQNIILSNQGIIKIVDFGIAKAKSNVQETQAGIIKGKLAYMSPEQVKGQSLDRRSDIFSLGIVLYELATHQRPFHGKSDIDMLRAILESKPKPIESLREFPPKLAAIIYRALAKNRDERYQSARDLQWDLENFLQSWQKPMGPFQLQELVLRVSQLTEKGDGKALSSTGSMVKPPPALPKTPTQNVPSYTPSHGQKGFDADDAFGGDQTMWTNSNEPNTPPASYPPAALQNYANPPSYAAPDSGSWAEAPTQWDPPGGRSNRAPSGQSAGWDEEDGDATVLSFPPSVGGNFPGSSAPAPLPPPPALPHHSNHPKPGGPPVAGPISFPPKPAGRPDFPPLAPSPKEQYTPEPSSGWDSELISPTQPSLNAANPLYPPKKKRTGLYVALGIFGVVLVAGLVYFFR